MTFQLPPRPNAAPGSQVYNNWLNLLSQQLSTTYAPIGASYILNTPNSSLSGAQALSSLSTGFAKVTTSTGIISTQAQIGSSDLTATGVVSGNYTINGGALFSVGNDGRLTTASNQLITTTGTANRVSVTGGATLSPTIDIDAAYVGQASITTLGTIGTGTWHGSLIAGTYGGTGVNNGSKTFTYLKNMSFTAADDTGVYTLPTGTKTLVDSTVTTLSSLSSIGTISTGVWQGTKVGLAYGGTNADLSATGGTSQVLKQVSSGAAITVGQLAESDLSFTDITTNNVSTTKHGFAPKAPNDATKYLDGTGAYSIPSGTGIVVQQVRTETGAVATGTTTVPLDDTIPQNTEGDQYMSLTITPTNTAHVLVIEVIGNFSPSVANFLIMSLFQDTTANALATVFDYQGANTGSNVIALRHYMTAGTTSATTFKVRCGQNTAGTTTFNGQVGSRLFGGVLASSITITEYKS